MAKITTETRGNARIIRYGNPPRDYLTADGAGQLAAAVQAAAADTSVRAIILTGEGKAFVRHYDVAEIVAAGGAVAADAIGAQAFESGPMVELLDACERAPKPVIAAINGVCMGGGFELALACDIRIVETDVHQIGLPETRVGIFPGGGGTQRLPRVIGEAAALNFILRGRVVDAGDAMDLGLVHDIAMNALNRALEIAAEFDGKGAEGVAAAKRLVRGALDRPLKEGLQDERRAFYEVLKADSAIDAMRTFLEGDGDITA